MLLFCLRPCYLVQFLVLGTPILGMFNSSRKGLQGSGLTQSHNRTTSLDYGSDSISHLQEPTPLIEQLSHFTRPKSAQTLSSSSFVARLIHYRNACTGAPELAHKMCTAALPVKAKILCSPRPGLRDSGNREGKKTMMGFSVTSCSNSRYQATS